MEQLETSRVTLRRLRSSDYDGMRALETDPQVMRFTPSRIPQSEVQTRERLASQIAKQKDLEPFGIWAVEEKVTGSFVGWFMLMPAEDKTLELGFMLVKSFQGKGLATEVGRALIDFGKSQGASGFTAKTTLDNANSMRVLEKLGFIHSRNMLVPEKVFGGMAELRFYELV